MRQFFIASHSSMKTGAIESLTVLNKGQIAFALSGGNTKITGLSPTSTELTTNKRFQMLIGDTDVDGQARHIVVPIYAHNMSYSHMSYVAPKTFTATIKVAAPSYAGTYTLMIVKKGVPFNERNKWTVDCYVSDTAQVSADKIASQLAKAINDKAEYGNEMGVTATVGGSANDELTITAVSAGVDYEIKLVDMLASSGASITSITHGETAVADTAMIIDMANKCIADNGINDTYQEASELMHPRYPITKGAASLAEQYDVVTLRFAEPREMKTRDDIVHQIVQIAFPRTSSGANGQLADFMAILDKVGATKLV